MDLTDAQAFVAVLRAGGFRQAARATGRSSSGLSAAVRRLEQHVGAGLLYRTTRNVTLTEAGRRLLDRLGPALDEAAAALEEAGGTSETPTGTVRLNVPVNVARLILPTIVPEFLAAHPGVRMEVTAQSDLVDILAAGYDAGVRYDDHLALDMVRIPIGPRVQRFATAAAPAYLSRMGTPKHPNDLLTHACLGDRSSAGRALPWEFERGGEIVAIDPAGPLAVGMGATIDLAVAAAVSGLGIVHTFEGWIRPEIDSGALTPVMEPWWQSFSGPYLYFAAGQQMPSALRAFIDFVKRP